MNKKKFEFQYLACPICKKKFSFVSENELHCDDCEKVYKIDSGIPIFDIPSSNLPKNKRWEDGQASDEARNYGKLIKEGKMPTGDFDLYEIHSILAERKVSNIRGTHSIDGALEIGPVNVPRIVYFDKNSFKFAIDIAMKDYYKHFEKLYTENNIIPINCMAEYLPLPDNSLDLIVASNSLDHCLSPLSVLKESRRVLRKNGIIFINT